jgi:ankyrin repeat protein
VRYQSAVGVMGKGTQTLLKAAQAGDVALLTRLLEGGASVGEVDQERSGVLHRAAREGNADALRLLLGWKADANARDRRQVSPLHEACKNGHGLCVALLLGCKADPNSKKMNSSVTNGGFTPLHFAASRGQLACMKALVEAGGDVFGGDRAGECPLHVAVRCDSLETVSWLLQQSLSPLVSSHNGRTPLHVAALHGRLHCAQALLDAAGSRAEELLLKGMHAKRAFQPDWTPDRLPRLKASGKVET